MRSALLIEDSQEYQLLIRAALSDFEVKGVVNADEALTAIQARTFDIIIIDVGLPGRDGLSLCEELRRDKRLQATPILFVTGRTTTADMVQGFQAGADDYIVKPFNPVELRTRVDARLRRAAAGTKNVDRFTKADLVFAVPVLRVYQLVDGKERDLELTPNEFKILYQLVSHEGQTLSRAAILSEVWGENMHVVERTVDKHICSLRRKMGSTALYLTSVPSEGYMFQATASSTTQDTGKIANAGV